MMKRGDLIPPEKIKAWVDPTDEIPPVFSPITTVCLKATNKNVVIDTNQYYKTGKYFYLRDVRTCDYYDNVICKRKNCENCKDRHNACYKEQKNGSLKSLHPPCEKRTESKIRI